MYASGLSIDVFVQDIHTFLCIYMYVIKSYSAKTNCHQDQRSVSLLAAKTGLEIPPIAT